MSRTIPMMAMVLSCLTVGAAQAQYSAVYRPTTPFGTQYTATLRSMASLNAYNALQRAGGRAPAQSGPAPDARAAMAPAAKAGPRHEVARTDFRPTGQRDTFRRLAESTTLADASKTEVTVFLRQIVGAVEGQPGFRRHNLANALAASIGFSLQVLGGRDLPESAIDNMIRVLNDELVDSGTFARMSDADRTRAYDTFLVVGALVGALAEKAKQTGDAELAAQARTMATETLRSLGFV